MDVIGFTSKLKQKLLTPKVYGVVLAGPPGQITLRVWAAYSLEEAIEKTARSIKEASPGTPIDEKPVVFQCVSVSELFEGVTQSEVTQETRASPDPPLDKSSIMREIVLKQNVALYEQLKPAFSAAERQLIEEKIEINH